MVRAFLFFTFFRFRAFIGAGFVIFHGCVFFVDTSLFLSFDYSYQRKISSPILFTNDWGFTSVIFQPCSVHRIIPICSSLSVTSSSRQVPSWQLSIIGTANPL